MPMLSLRSMLFSKGIKLLTTPHTQFDSLRSMLFSKVIKRKERKDYHPHSLRSMLFSKVIKLTPCQYNVTTWFEKYVI